LCAYLGQLAAIRDELRGAVTVVIGEKEQGELADTELALEESDSPSTWHHRVPVSKQVGLPFYFLSNYDFERDLFYIGATAHGR
jgi:hypothetical protein